MEVYEKYKIIKIPRIFFKEIHAILLTDDQTKNILTVHFTKDIFDTKYSMYFQKGAAFPPLQNLKDELSEKLKLRTGKAKHIYDEKNKEIKCSDEFQDGLTYICTSQPIKSCNYFNSSKAQNDIFSKRRKNENNITVIKNYNNTSKKPYVNPYKSNINLQPKIIEIVGDEVSKYKKSKYVLNIKYTPNIERLLTDLQRKGIFGKIYGLYSTDGIEMKNIEQLYSSGSVFYTGKQYEQLLKTNPGAKLHSPKKWKMLSG